MITAWTHACSASHRKRRPHLSTVASKQRRERVWRTGGALAV